MIENFCLKLLTRASYCCIFVADSELFAISCKCLQRLVAFVATRFTFYLRRLHALFFSQKSSKFQRK